MIHTLVQTLNETMTRGAGVFRCEETEFTITGSYPHKWKLMFVPQPSQGTLEDSSVEGFAFYFVETKSGRILMTLKLFSNKRGEQFLERGHTVLGSIQEENEHTLLKNSECRYPFCIDLKSLLAYSCGLEGNYGVQFIMEVEKIKVFVKRLTEV